ncbi:MAG: helix-turn-helix domain-containing protein [Methylophilaceae bacterium]
MAWITTVLSVTKIRIYPNVIHADKLAQAFGCVRWYWNNSLVETQKVYLSTNRHGIGQFQLDARLPKPKGVSPLHCACR